jgi:glutaminyl-peptide cyclotransferase
MKFVLLGIIAVFLTACNKKPETLSYKIISTRPHDPESYTQGLEFLGNRLFESSGGYGNSNVREADPLTGKVIRKRPMAKNIFAEGITILNNEMFVLSWKENIVNVLEPDTFKFIRSHNYKGEGWGLTNDGKQLIMSNGSSSIQFIDPKDFSVKRSIEVTRSGNPVMQINELELIDGQIFANIYQTGEVIRISPESGKVSGTLDLSALRTQLPRPNKADVLNGIARDPATGNLLVTGKLWPTMFEIKISGK